MYELSTALSTVSQRADDENRNSLLERERESRWSVHRTSAFYLRPTVHRRKDNIHAARRSLNKSTRLSRSDVAVARSLNRPPVSVVTARDSSQLHFRFAAAMSLRYSLPLYSSVLYCLVFTVVLYK